MGTLRRIDDRSHCVTLRAAHLIGRADHCALRLSAPTVSGEHASLRWTGQQWVLRDLGSRNGTWVDGDRVEPGQAWPLQAGATLSFGSPEPTWRIESVAAPVVRAEAPGLEPVLIDGGMVVLPDMEQPLLVVYCDQRGRWVAERPDGSLSPVADLDVLQVGQVPWTLHIPQAVTGTIELDAHRVLTFEVELRIEERTDGELWIEVHLPGGGRVLPPKAHHRTLLALAKAREADTDLPRAERGWRRPDDLERLLHLDHGSVRDHVYRARRELAALGVDDAVRVIEQHPDTGAVRLGSVRLALTLP
ncbi:MAG: FHA domain-containing protein [Alphaproteobacteria bacterium]|nr:FHA domain-containing protein [Alphaproteobacteria bacterium]